MSHRPLVPCILLATVLAAGVPPLHASSSPWSLTVPGTSGTGGVVPLLQGSGPLVPFSANALELTGAAPQRPAVLVAGLAELALPFKGGTLGPAPQWLVPLLTDAAGDLSLSFTLGDGPAGLSAFVQVWVADDGAALGWAASNGLGLQTQPAPPAAALRYVKRHDKDPKRLEQDHLMGVEPVLSHHALACSWLGLKLLDLDALTPEGNSLALKLLPGLDCTTTHTRADGWSYVNLRQGGFAVVRVTEQAPYLSLVTQVSEPGVFFEKMCVQGDRLYVAAHAYGLRIYSLADPAAPQLVGSLDEGFADAFAVDVAGARACVADGDAGLKLVDITDESAPAIVFAEDPLATPGAAEDVRIWGDRIYVAHGSAGVAVHRLDDPSVRTLHDTPTCAKHLARAGEWLGVADIGGLEVFRILPDGALAPAARERGMYRYHPGAKYHLDLSLRLWHGVAGLGADRFLVAAWDTVDVYDVVDPAFDDQPDIGASSQRLRFAPAGGTQVVTLSSRGSGPLHITSITADNANVSLGATSATLQPGQTLDLSISYAGGQPGTGLVRVNSDDPDEALLPIQVLGETAFIDPTEPALPFTLPSWTYDHATGSFLQDTFDLDLEDGQVLFFQAFATW